MYGKPVMACFKYQVDLYSSEPSHTVVDCYTLIEHYESSDYPHSTL
jgi:hypothetical protein